VLCILGEVAEDYDAKRALYLAPTGLEINTRYALGLPRTAKVAASAHLVAKFKIEPGQLKDILGRIRASQ